MPHLPSACANCTPLVPGSTHAWNALLVGRKRWALYPPGVPRADLVPAGMEKEASTWFQEVYPRTKVTDCGSDKCGGMSCGMS